MKALLLLSTLALLWQCASPAQSQEAKAKTAAGAQTVRVAQLPRLVNQFVVVDGITGQKRDDPARNTKVYSLVDDYNDLVWVRTKQDYPVIGTHFRVSGIVVMTDGQLFIVEQNRMPLSQAGTQAQAANEKPDSSKSDKSGKSDDSGGMSKTTMIGIGLIILAVIVSIVIVVTVRSQQQQQMLAMEQQRQAAERERMRIEAERMSASNPRVSPQPHTVADPPRQRKPQHTIDAWGQIKITAGPHAGQIIPMSGHQISIGRANGDIKLSDDPVASSDHGEIVVTNDGRLLYVDKSRNGSLVDGNPVHRAQAEIKPGSVIEIGSSKLELIAARIPSIGSPARSSSSSAPTMAGDMPDMPSAKTGVFMGVELLVVSGPDKDKRYPVGKERITIGRRDDQDFRLTDSFVSREHAVLFQRGDEWVLQNCSSKGTTVNSEQAEETTLSHGDRIAVGSTVLEFQTMAGAIAGLNG